MGNLEYERLHENLKAMDMEKMSDILDSYLEVAAKEDLSTIQILDHLINEQYEAKRQKLIDTRIRFAKLPYQKTLEEFDFDFQPSIDKKMINDLAGMKFVYNKENAILLGPPGVGKTHLAIALGISAIKEGFSVYFRTAADLISDLRKFSNQGILKQKVTKWNRIKLLIIDEVGYLPMERDDANLLFQLISRRYEKGSILLTSNKPFREWGSIFKDEIVAAAILDRLLHHSTVVNIKGESYRVKERKRVGLLRTEASEGKTE
jgi:DNA replication protein DnaC